MWQLLVRVLGCLRRPVVAALWLLLAGGGAALVWVPLLGLPGYELSAVLALAHGLLAAVFGIAAARQERRLIQGKDPRPKNATRYDSPLTSSLLALGTGVALSWSALVPPLLASVIYALASTRCDPFVHVMFFPLLALPSALLSVASGIFAGFRGRGWFTALLWHGLLVLVSAVVTVWPIVFGPQVFAFNHFGGYLPGPLYDEALSVTAAVWWFRLETVLWALGLWLLIANGLDMREGRLSRPHFRLGSGLLLAAIGFSLFTLEQRAASLGTRMSDEVLSERLGGKRESAHVVLHHPRGMPKPEVERALRDLEFRHHQVSQFFGEPPPGKVVVWWYRSPAEKQKLVGAEHTQFAKPWRREIHVNTDRFPHDVAKHELVHAMAAPYGSAPFGVAATGFGLLPIAGVIEGLAVAGDDPLDSLSLHEWAAGMKKEKLLPDVRELMTALGFYRSPPSRAYSAAGSFLRWLGDTRGGEKLRALYRHGDFREAYGQSLDQLATEWESFLDQLPLEPQAVHEAFARFRRKALFSRPCAREVASLSREGAELLNADPDAAVERYQRCAQLQPEEPGHVLAEAAALIKAGKRADARSLLDELATKVEKEPSTAAEVAMAQADLAWTMERKDAAKAHLSHVLSLDPSPAMERTARVRLSAIAAPPEVGAAIVSYFKPGADDVKLLVLREALARMPGQAEAAYLIGRKLSQGDQPALARHYLDQALEQPDLPASIRRESLRLKLEVTFLAGDCEAVKAQVDRLPDYGTVFSRQATEWVERCGFEQQAFGGVLVPDDGLR